jgi:hypothetical protein
MNKKINNKLLCVPKIPFSRREDLGDTLVVVVVGALNQDERPSAAGSLSSPTTTKSPKPKEKTNSQSFSSENILASLMSYPRNLVSKI